MTKRKKILKPKLKKSSKEQNQRPKLEEIRFLSGDDSLSKETWRLFRIQSEFIKGLNKLYGLSKGISIFGSARVTEGSEYYNAFFKGYYAIEAKRRASLIKVAIGGSSEAQKQVNELRDKVIIDIS